MRFFLLIRTWIVSILLAGAVVFFGYQTFEIWSADDRLEVHKPVPKPPTPRADRRVAYRRNPPYRTYEVIAGKDLFSSDRREKLPEKPRTPSPVKSPKSLNHGFALFGIVIDGNEKKALVSNLDRKTVKEKQYIWVEVGDKIGNLNVSEIKPEQLIITQGGSAYTIRLSDQSHPQKRSIGRKVVKRTGPSTKSIKKPEANSSAAEKSKP